jgi:ActR/RegA family two-component response regulator
MSKDGVPPKSKGFDKSQAKDWRHLAQKAAKEKDSHKLLAIIEELNAALESRERPLRASTSTPVRTSERVSNQLLFVDDEPSIRMTLPLLLKERGFEVHVAASVPEALTAIGIQKFDVLLSDLNIGVEGDGFAVVDAMRKSHPNCVTILLTGYPAFETALQAIHGDVDDYFVKPADIDSLVSTMQRRLLDRSHPLKIS